VSNAARDPPSASSVAAPTVMDIPLQRIVSAVVIAVVLVAPVFVFG
jgi:hypothetical protein